MGLMGQRDEVVAQLSADAVAFDGRPDGAPDRERHTRPVACPVVTDDGDGTGSCSTPVFLQFGECAPATDTSDQADSFCLPRRRRRLTMARPARVDIRLRKPWRLARRRTFGW